MKTISLKSQAILSKIGISLYKKRECSNLNDAKEIVLHKRDNILALLPKELNNHTNNEINLFNSIMQTMTSNDPTISELKALHTAGFNINTYYEKRKELHPIKAVISFGIKVDPLATYIQAPFLESLINDPSQKRPLWQEIQKFLSK